MAIYHFSVKTISRSDGRSAVAAAAYRAAEKLTCDYYGKEQDYTKKSGVEHTQIYAPENTQEELLDRQTLWNTVEKSERRKDALLAREFEIAFPQELNKEQRQAMLNELCQDLVKRHGVIVDAAIHAPHTDGGSDKRNYHAHIMFTTRAIDPENGEFSAKKYRDFSRDNGTETVSRWRKDFADLANRHLEQAGVDVRIDHRSYADQNHRLQATSHEGPSVTALRRQYEREQQKPFNERNHEIVLPALAKQNDAIKLFNLELEITATEKLIKTMQHEAKKTFESILSEEKTTNFENFDQILQKSHETRSEKNIFDTLNSSISQLNRSELFSQLDKTLESHAEVEREAAVKANVEREAKHQAELKADAEHQAQETEPKAERKATIEREKEHQNDRGNDFNPF
ncbi:MULTISPECIES: MobQ family relaxase [Acinetobacter]|mgnify:CR=1 FL=1|jgi:ATP-dependent exoDNAse (exonuclease V) alpha subunit|nr:MULTISPECIES: MobQ family relaxase [Acinetobacter]MDI6622787.1 MobQ family relaxase [Acinetobacter junii]